MVHWSVDIISFHILFSIIFVIHDSLHIVLQTLPLPFLLRHNILSLSLIHQPPSTSNVLTSLNISTGQVLNRASLLSAYFTIALETGFLFAHQYLSLFSTTTSTDSFVCLNIAAFTAPFHHIISHLIRIRFVSLHTSPHAFKIHP